jgi:O-antigen/teichoic acid export membrane protein
VLLLVLSSFSDGRRKIWHGVLARDIVQPAAAFLVACLLLSAGLGLVGAVQAYVLSVVLAALLAFFFLRAYYAHARFPVVDLKHYSSRAILTFSLPFLPMTLLRQATGLNLEIYLLGYLGSAETVGIFSAAAGTAFFISFGLNAVVRIYSTMASELHAKKEIGQLERLLQTVTYWSTCLSLPGAIGLGLFGDSVLRLFGERFSTEGTAVLMILALGQLVNAVTGPVGVTLTMAGYSRLILVNNMVALIVNVALDWWLIGLWGVMGAAIGNTVVMTGLNLAYMLEAKRLVGVSSLSSKIFRPSVASILTIGVMLVVVRFLGTLPAMLEVAIGLVIMAAVYLALLWRLSPPGDRRAIAVALEQAREFATIAGLKKLFTT